MKIDWRPRSELNRRTRLCRPLHNHSATRPRVFTLPPIPVPLSYDAVRALAHNSRYLKRHQFRTHIAIRLNTTRIATPINNKTPEIRGRDQHQTCRRRPTLSNRPSSGAGNETRTRDPDLGKVVLYQLSYSRLGAARIRIRAGLSTFRQLFSLNTGHEART